MGLFDAIKQLFGGSPAAEKDSSFETSSAPRSGERSVSSDDDDDNDSSSEEFDIAGFDPEGDENAYFEAQTIIESEGFGGGSDEDRTRVMAQYGIRDHSHWLTVKESVWQVLVRKHGSFEVAAQRQSNFSTDRAQALMGQKQAVAIAGGALQPIEGISLEKWAAINAAIVQGNSLEDLLKGNGIDAARWDRAKSEWEARMASDTTFAVATVYGQAFQAASQSKYTALAKEANAARAASADPTSAPPMSVADYFRLLFEQEAGSRAGADPQAVLKAQGLSIVDWIDLSTFMGYYIQRNHVRLQPELDKADAIRDEVLAKYPSVSKQDLDISF